MFVLFGNRCLKHFYRKSIQTYKFIPTINTNYSNSPVCPPPNNPACPPTKKSGDFGPCGGNRGPGGTKKNITITCKPYVPPCPQDHDYKNMSLNRPMSPHLEVFKLTKTAAMSIMQRITGVILASYAVMLAGGALFLPNGIETYVSMIQSLDLGRMSTFLVKILVGGPFMYHYYNGIRFCMWNAGHWLKMSEVDKTAKSTIMATAISVVIFALIF